MGNRTLFIPLGGGLDPTDYYTKEEINQMFSEQSGYTVVSTLPTTGDPTKIYLVGPTGSGADQYEEYVYADDNWVKIGDTSMDLSGYVTDTELGTALAAKQDTLTAGTGIAIGTDNVISATVNTEEIEHAIAAAINDTRDSINQDLHNNYVLTQTMNDQLKNYAPKAALDGYYTKTQTDTAIGSIYAEIEDKERATSFALNDLEENKQDALTAGAGITIGTDGTISADIPTLATVATTGNYADLNGTPTIPTVGTGVITLTSNGDTIGTFGLNDTDDKTIEIPAGGGSSSNAWYGSQYQFDTLGTYDPDTDYYISDRIDYSEIKGKPNLDAFETKADSQAADQALDEKIDGKMDPIVFVGTAGLPSIGTPLEGVTYAIEGETVALTFTLANLSTVTYNFVID